MKHALALAAMLSTALAMPALAQDLSLSLETSAEGDVNAQAPLDAQITGDNSFVSLTAAITANESVDLAAVTDEAKVKLVLVSTLEGDAATQSTALDAAITAQATALATLRTNVAASSAISAKLKAEGYTADDVLAVKTDASGNTLVYVDDRS
jgi:hypothetical protein